MNKGRGDRRGLSQARGSPPRRSTPGRPSTGGINVFEAKRLKQLEEENAKAERLLADAMLDNAALKDLMTKKGAVPDLLMDRI